MNFPLDAVPPKYNLQEIKVLINELDIDPLKNSGVKVVHPVGNGSSGIFMIGEAPGAKEDELGEPFVGSSGQLLNNILLPSVGLNRGNIYLTNIVKCRPPNNRDPLPVEIEAWSPVLLAEIIAIEPKVVVCLGRHSLGFFMPDAKISKVHGQIQYVEIFKDHIIPILPLYHPAVALYNPAMKETLKQDFLIIKTILGSDFNLEPGNDDEVKVGLF